MRIRLRKDFLWKIKWVEIEEIYPESKTWSNFLVKMNNVGVNTSKLKKKSLFKFQKVVNSLLFFNIIIKLIHSPTFLIFSLKYPNEFVSQKSKQKIDDGSRFSICCLCMSTYAIVPNVSRNKIYIRCRQSNHTRSAF